MLARAGAATHSPFPRRQQCAGACPGSGLLPGAGGQLGLALGSLGCRNGCQSPPEHHGSLLAPVPRQLGAPIERQGVLAGLSAVPLLAHVVLGRMSPSLGSESRVGMEGGSHMTQPGGKLCLEKRSWMFFQLEA